MLVWFCGSLETDIPKGLGETYFGTFYHKKTKNRLIRNKCRPSDSRTWGDIEKIKRRIRHRGSMGGG